MNPYIQHSPYAHFARGFRPYVGQIPGLPGGPPLPGTTPPAPAPGPVPQFTPGPGVLVVEPTPSVPLALIALAGLGAVAIYLQVSKHPFAFLGARR